VNSIDHISKALILLVALDAWVVDVGRSAQVLNLGFLVLVSNNPLLVSSKTQKFRFIFWSQALELVNS